MQDYYRRGRRDKKNDARNYAELVLMAVSDDWFASVLTAGSSAATQAGMDALDPGGVGGGYRLSIGQLFERNGVPFRFEGDQLVRTGDPTLAAAATQPALSVLDDPRLAEARRHFDAARADLQREDPEDAVDEARQAIEAALLAYIDVVDGDRPDRHQPDSLFEAARGAGLAGEAKELVLGAARYRGRTRAGHAGRVPVSMGDAEAVLGSAASALVFIGRSFPGA